MSSISRSSTGGTSVSGGADSCPSAFKGSVKAPDDCTSLSLCEAVRKQEVGKEPRETQSQQDDESVPPSVSVLCVGTCAQQHVQLSSLMSARASVSVSAAANSLATDPNFMRINQSIWCVPRASPTLCRRSSGRTFPQHPDCGRNLVRAHGLGHAEQSHCNGDHTTNISVVPLLTQVFRSNCIRILWIGVSCKASVSVGGRQFLSWCPTTEISLANIADGTFDFASRSHFAQNAFKSQCKQAVVLLCRGVSRKRNHFDNPPAQRLPNLPQELCSQGAFRSRA